MWMKTGGGHCIIALHVACTDMFGMISDVFSTMDWAFAAHGISTKRRAMHDLPVRPQQ
jgi:hypothetical protein